VGGAELPELRRQTADYASSLRVRGELVEEIAAPGYNHFTILETLALPNGAALEAVVRHFLKARSSGSEEFITMETTGL
jgi:hypothetical protein